MNNSNLLHGEYKIPNGKLVVIDLKVIEGRLQEVSLSGDFFMEPPETLDVLNAAITGLPIDSSPEFIKKTIEDSINPEVTMYGLTVDGIVTVIQRAVACRN